MDLTVVAIPAYFGSMGAEYAVQKRRAERDGPTPGTYERDDTLASLAMGVGSLVAPYAVGKLLEQFQPRTGRLAKALLLTTAGAAAVAVAADAIARQARSPLPAGVLPPRIDLSSPARPADRTLDPAMGAEVVVDEALLADEETPADLDRARRRRIGRIARRVGGSAAAAAVVGGAVAVAARWSTQTGAKRLWNRRIGPDLGSGPLAVAGAILAWDFIYYWNHRLAHESRYLWAMHVVHHSSEHYNLSTALRQPVADALVLTIPYSALALLGFRPDVIETARGVNLLYQFWIHTELIDKLPGRAEEVLNSPSLHRVHHGSNRRYLDRNHGSILIVWDRLFGTHQVEDEPVVYGLTKNIDTFNPARIATHEFADIVTGVSRASTWTDRLSYVLRGPGWAYDHPTRPLPALTA